MFVNNCESLYKKISLTKNINERVEKGIVERSNQHHPAFIAYYAIFISDNAALKLYYNDFFLFFRKG